MAKRRRTRKEKIIAQLRRKLKAQEKQQQVEQTETLEERINPKIKIRAQKRETSPITNYQLLITDDLIKKDLLKTLYLSFLFTGIIFSLFWYFEKGGEAILKSFHLLK